MRVCPGCGAALEPQSVACAACGRLVREETAPVATADRRRAGEMVLAVFGGLALGSLLGFVSIFVTIAVVAPNGVVSPASLTTLTAVEGIAVVVLLAVAIRLAARGRVRLAVFLVVTMLVTAVPAGACDASFVGIDGQMQL